MRKFVFPGDKISDRVLKIPYVYSDGKASYAEAIGILDSQGRYVPLESPYLPQVGDQIVGIITGVKPIGYKVDINTAGAGFLHSRETRMRFHLGDFIVAVVKMVDEAGNVDLKEARRLPRGKVIDFPSSKIPRLIGRHSSMINLIKKYAGEDIVIGKNGYIWIGERANIPLFISVAKFVEVHAPQEGLTDKVANMLSKMKRE